MLGLAVHLILALLVLALRCILACWVPVVKLSLQLCRGTAWVFVGFPVSCVVAAIVFAKGEVDMLCRRATIALLALPYAHLRLVYFYFKHRQAARRLELAYDVLDLLNENMQLVDEGLLLLDQIKKLGEVCLQIIDEVLPPPPQAEAAEPSPQDAAAASSEKKAAPSPRELNVCLKKEKAYLQRRNREIRETMAELHERKEYLHGLLLELLQQFPDVVLMKDRGRG